MTMDELKNAVAVAVEKYIESSEAAIKEYVGELTDTGKARLRELVTKIGHYTLKAETDTDPAEKEGFRHLIRAQVSQSASIVSIESSEARSFLRGLLDGAKAAISELLPVVVKGLIG